MEISVTGFKSKSNCIKLIGTLGDTIAHGRVMPKPRLYMHFLVSILNAVRYNNNWSLIMKTKHVSVCDVLPVVKKTDKIFVM